MNEWVSGGFKDTESTVLDTVDEAILQFAAGRPVLVVDDEDRENEGDFIMAAEVVTAEWMAFIVRYSGGVVCAPMDGDRLDQLKIPPMTAVNEDVKGTAFTVSVEARTGVTTGISAADRAQTLRVLADPKTEVGDLRRPGHVFPLRAHPGGLLERRGHTEATLELTRLAGLQPVGIISEVVNDDGTMARLPQLRVFADEHHLKLISIEQLVAHNSQALVDALSSHS